MIHPSYTELISAINNNAEDDDNTMMLNSRYSLVLATSKRARQLVGGAEPLVKHAAGRKPLSIAIDEFYQGKVKIAAVSSDSEADSLPENTVSAQTEEIQAAESEEDSVSDAGPEAAEDVQESLPETEQ